MKRFFLTILTILILSGVIFPFSFKFFPAQNTKNLLAAVGMVVYVIGLAVNHKRFSVEKGTISVFLMAFAVGFMALFTMIYHNTSDSTYVSYPLTLVLWLCAGYASISLMKASHGYASVSLLTQYLTVVSVMQCTIALLIDYMPAFEEWVNSWMTFMDKQYWKETGRLYGIGCALDVAGVRFSCILLMLAHLCYEASRERDIKKLLIGLICFAIIAVVGNMISRTTLVGVAAACVLWLLLTIIPSRNALRNISSLWGCFIVIVTIVSIICIRLYNTNEKTRDNIRFGFEGFFSIVEKGHWETNSNNMLKDMVIWPDNPGTWILGDGYMIDPAKVEDYLIKNDVAGEANYYKGTDVGYCRFIFYFGIIGLLVFTAYFAVAAAACGARAPSKKICFFMLWVINMIVWAKVTTDIFAVLCLFLLTDIEEEDDDEDDLELEEVGEEAIV